VGIVVLLLEKAGPVSSCGEGSRLGASRGGGGLRGTLGGNYGPAGTAFLREKGE